MRALPDDAPGFAQGPQEVLRCLTVQKGRDLTLITVEDVCYFRADSKNVAVVTADDEALISMSFEELVARLDSAMFLQIDRGIVVNINAVCSVQRTVLGHLQLRLKHRTEKLRVSSIYAHLFRS